MSRVVFLALVACSYDPTRAPATLDDAPVDTPPVGTDVVMTCPLDYVVALGSRYKFVATPTDWVSAERDCEADGFGVHLAVAPEPGEHETIDSVSGASRTWIGLSNRPGPWRWVDGSPGPTLDGDSNQCGERYDGSGGGQPGFQASDCNSQHAYVCECDLEAPDPMSSM